MGNLTATSNYKGLTFADRVPNVSDKRYLVRLAPDYMDPPLIMACCVVIEKAAEYHDSSGKNKNKKICLDFFDYN